MCAPITFDFQEALDKARANQVPGYRVPSNKLSWPVRNAKGEGRRQAQSKRVAAGEWMARKMDKHLEEKFWQEADKRQVARG